MTSRIGAGGLLLDVVGAFVLAMSFMFRRPKHARRETAMYVGGNPFLYLSLARQTADAWVGGTLLAAGFLAQFADAVTTANALGLAVTIPLAVAIDAAAIALLVKVIRPWFVARALEHQLAFRWREYEDEYASKPGEAARSWWTGVDIWGRYVVGPRRHSEALPEYGARLLGRERWNRVVPNEPPPPDYTPPPDLPDDD